VGFGSLVRNGATLLQTHHGPEKCDDGDASLLTKKTVSCCWDEVMMRERRRCDVDAGRSRTVSLIRLIGVYSYNI
jgi:hypothetical protein